MRIMKSFVDGIVFVGKVVFSLIKHFLIGLFVVLTIYPKYFGIGMVYLLDRRKREQIKQKRGKPIIPLIMMILSLIIYLIMVFIFTRWYVQNKRIEYLQDDILNSTVRIEEIEKDLNTDSSTGENNEIIADSNYSDVPYIDVDFTNLLNTNSETVAWIKVNGTIIDYPVVQHNDNDYYLHHDFYGNATDLGWVFGDYRDNFSTFGYNTIIYAHNLINDTMFGSLSNVLTSSWQNNTDNHYVKISTPTSNTVWKVFSVYTIVPTVDYLKTSFTENEYQEFLNMLTGRSVYNFDVPLSTSDKIITLSTCDDAGTKRLVVHAKLVKVQYK